MRTSAFFTTRRTASSSLSAHAGADSSLCAPAHSSLCFILASARSEDLSAFVVKSGLHRSEDLVALVVKNASCEA